MTERDYFEDIVVEGDDAPTEAEEAEMDAVQAEIEAEPPSMAEIESVGASPAVDLSAPDRTAPDDIAQREKYERQSGLSGGLPTTKPEDPTVQWSPRPGIVGCDAKGYHKIR